MGAFDPAKASVATGFMLLAINDSRLISSTGDPSDKYGTLEIICVTINSDLDARVAPSDPLGASSIPGSRTPVLEAERDVWLVLRISGFEMPISPVQTIMHSRSKGTFTFIERPGEKSRSITIVVPTAEAKPHLAEDLETLEVLFTQYGILQQIDRDELGSDGDLKGRLVLVDENDGEYVGWLGDDIGVTEDPRVGQTGKDPVVVEISEDGKHLDVHPAQFEDEDMLMRGADLVSRGIVYFGDTLAAGFSMASNMYRQHATPSVEPMEFSEATRRRVQRVHTFSGQAVTITQKTTGMIHKLIDSLASKMGSSGTSTPKPTDTSSSSRTDATLVEKPKKRKFLNRVLLSTNMIISAVEQSATTLIESGNKSIAQGVHHKYGAEAGDMAESVGQTVQNVSVVYIDARGVGRRALLKRMGKRVIKAKMGRKSVVIGADPPVAGPSTAPDPSRRAITPPPPLPPRSRGPSPSPGPQPSVARHVPPPSYRDSLTGSMPVPPPLPPRNSYSKA